MDFLILRPQYTAFGMQRLTIRKATPADTDRIAELFAGDPGDEAIGIAGSREKAIAFGTGMVRLPDSAQGWRQTVVAELDGLVAGSLMAGGDHEGTPVTPRLVYLAVRTFGPPGLPRLLPRLRARARVSPRPPDGAHHT